MAILGRLIAEGALQQNLTRRTGQQVGAAHDFSDALTLVIDDDSEVIGKWAVPPLNDKVTRFRSAILPDHALENVCEFDSRLARRNAEPKRVRSAAGQSAVPAGAGVHWLRGRIGGQRGCNRRAAATTRITEVGGSERRKRVPVGINSIRLEINASIPLESKSFQRSRKLCRQIGHAALAVEIVDAQQPAAAATADAQVAAGGCQQRSKMERSGGSGGEAAAEAAARWITDTSRRDRRTVSRGARAAPVLQCIASPPAALRDA